MPENDHDAWKRLGDLLTRRRIELDPRYSNRRVFCAERGVEYRMINAIELGRRTNFDRTTLVAFEVAYELRPGNIGRILDGGNLEPAAPSPDIASRADPHEQTDGPVAAPVLDEIDQERLRPYLEQVLREIQKAVAKHGADPRGEQIFKDPDEIEHWDTSPWSRADRVRGVAAMRMLVDDVLHPGRGAEPGRDANAQLSANCNKSITMSDEW